MKITSLQLRRLIQEESRRILREEAALTPEEPQNLEKEKKLQQDLTETLMIIEDELLKLIKHVRERKNVYGGNYRGPESFGPQGQTVNLIDVYNAIQTQRDIEQSAPDYGGGMYKLPDPK